jgi:hypothetical protein
LGQADGMSVGTLVIACGGLTFLLSPFQYLVGWEEINLAISMNLFRFKQYENYQRRSLAPIRYAARTVRIKLFFRASTKIL